MLVVISIIALLSSVVMVAVGKAREKAQISKFRSEVREFVSALEIYRINNGHYPECSNNYSEGCFYYGSGDAASGFYLDAQSSGLSILNQLKAKKLFTGNFILNKPSFWTVSVEYRDVSMGTNNDLGGDVYNSDPFSSLKLADAVFGASASFNGKKTSDLREYSFCLSITDSRAGYTGDIGSISNLSKTSWWGEPAYCSGN